MFIYILRSTSHGTKVWCKTEVVMTKNQALPYLEVGMIQLLTLVNPCSRPDCWSGSCHLLCLPPQMTTWALLTKRQETSVGFLTEHHWHWLWAWDLFSYGCWFLREPLGSTQIQTLWFLCDAEKRQALLSETTCKKHLLDFEFSGTSEDDRAVRPRTAELQAASEQKSRSVIPSSPRKQMKGKLKNSVRGKGKELLKAKDVCKL